MDGRLIITAIQKPQACLRCSRIHTIKGKGNKNHDLYTGNKESAAALL